MTVRLPLALATIVLGATVPASAQGPVRATAHVRAVVEVLGRTALDVSANVVRFVVPPGASSATATLDFTAGVRTSPDRQVLIVGDAAGTERLVLEFRGDGASGRIVPGESAVLAQWSGGGRRHGHIVFTLHDAAPGTYSVPIHLTISVP